MFGSRESEVGQGLQDTSELVRSKKAFATKRLEVAVSALK